MSKLHEASRSCSKLKSAPIQGKTHILFPTIYFDRCFGNQLIFKPRGLPHTAKIGKISVIINLAWYSQARYYSEQCDSFCVVRDPMQRLISHMRMLHRFEQVLVSLFN